MKNIYLDCAASAKIQDDVLQSITPYITNKWHNPSSLYANGVNIKNDIKAVRNQIANLIHAQQDEIYFTSGACESNSWVIRGWDDYISLHYGKLYTPCIITTTIEHKSMMQAINNPMLNAKVCLCNVDNDGLIDMEQLSSLLQEHNGNPILVTVSMANNEIGTIQNIKEVSTLVHKYNGYFHTDATQAIPYLPIDVEYLGIDMLSASAQKFGGIKGTGFLYKNNNVHIMPLIYGSQESGIRGGTENVVGIIAMGCAISHVDYKIQSRVCMVRDYFISKLEDIGCKLNGSKMYRLPTNINVVLPDGISGESMLYMLDMSGIELSTGSACNSSAIEPSYVLKAIGLSDEESYRSIRITFPFDISLEDIDYTIEEIKKNIQLLNN